RRDQLGQLFVEVLLDFGLDRTVQVIAGFDGAAAQARTAARTTGVTTSRLATVFFLVGVGALVFVLIIIVVVVAGSGQAVFVRAFVLVVARAGAWLTRLGALTCPASNRLATYSCVVGRTQIHIVTARGRLFVARFLVEVF